MRKFLDYVAEADPRLFALWRLAALTGLRRGELLGLSSFPPGAARPTKSRRSHRTVALDTEPVTALREHREAQLLERAFLGAGFVDHDLVFAREDGTPIHPQRPTEAFSQHRKAAGIPTGTLHVLRHTATTLALMEGVPLHVVAARIGDDPKVVLATYAHLLPTSDAEAADRVAALVA